MKGRKLLILQYGRSCKNGPSAELGYTAGTRNRFAKFAFREKFHVSREVTFSRITSAHGAWSPIRAPWHHAERMYEARPMMGKSADGRPGTSRFDRFVRSYGIERLAKRLDITRWRSSTGFAARCLHTPQTPSKFGSSQRNAALRCLSMKSTSTSARWAVNAIQIRERPRCRRDRPRCPLFNGCNPPAFLETPPTGMLDAIHR